VGLASINVPGLELKRYGLGQQVGQRVSNLHSCEKTNSSIEPPSGEIIPAWRGRIINWRESLDRSDPPRSSRKTSRSTGGVEA
jgi:hypothetical protein